MLNVRGVKEVREVQKIAVEKSRLGIPLIIGFDLGFNYGFKMSCSNNLDFWVSDFEFFLEPNSS